MVAKNKSLQPGEMVVGRKLMLCCSEDIQFKGMLCKCDTAAKYKSNDWIYLTAKIVFEAHRLYRGGHGPVLYANAVKRAEPADPEVAV